MTAQAFIEDTRDMSLSVNPMFSIDEIMHNNYFEQDIQPGTSLSFDDWEDDNRQAPEVDENSLQYRLNVCQDSEAQHGSILSSRDLPRMTEPALDPYWGFNPSQVHGPSEYMLPEAYQEHQHQYQGTYLAPSDNVLPRTPADKGTDIASMQNTPAQQAAHVKAAEQQYVQEQEERQRKRQQQAAQVKVAEQQYVQEQEERQKKRQQQVQSQAQGIVATIEEFDRLYEGYNFMMQMPSSETSGASFEADLGMPVAFKQSQEEDQAQSNRVGPWTQGMNEYQAMPDTGEYQAQHHAYAGPVNSALPVIPAPAANPAPTVNPAPAPQATIGESPTGRVRKSKNKKWLANHYKYDASKPLKNESRPGMATGYKADTYEEKRQRCRGDNCNQTRQYCQCPEFVV